MYRCLIVAAALALIAPCFARADERSDFLATAKVLDAASAKGDCGKGAPAVAKFTASPLFNNLPDDVQAQVWEFGANCALEASNQELLLEYARHGTALPKASDWLWTARVDTGMYLDRPDDVADALEALSQIRPAVISTLSPNSLSQFTFEQLGAAGRQDVAARVFAALDAADYKSSDPGQRADVLWFNYARMELDRGNGAHAAKLMQKVTVPIWLMEARLDKRFADIVSAAPTQFDVGAAMNAELTEDRAAMMAQPDKLALVVAVSNDLFSLGRTEEALDLDQSALDRMASATKQKPAFSDQDDAANWVTDAKSRNLMALGRIAEAVDVERSAARLKEQGADNVSQVINLASALLEADRPEEVFADLKRIDEPGGPGASPYGLGWVHTNRACADAVLGRTTELAAEMSYLDQHQRDNTDARTTALLCAGSEDQLAAEFIAELDDPLQRDAALLNLSTFNDPPHPTAYEARLRARLEAVRRRADVQAEVAKVGHTEHFDLQGDLFQNLF